MAHMKHPEFDKFRFEDRLIEVLQEMNNAIKLTASGNASVTPTLEKITADLSQLRLRIRAAIAENREFI